MSSISITRQHIQNTTNWSRYREHRAHLADLFPVIRYSGQPKTPLCCQIKYDLIGANTGLSSDDIKHFLRAYTFGPKYLRALRVDAARFDLWGEPVGVVTEDEAEYARLCLEAHYEMRRAGRVGMGAVRAAITPQQEDDELLREWRGGRGRAPHRIQEAA